MFGKQWLFYFSVEMFADQNIKGNAVKVDACMWNVAFPNGMGIKPILHKQ